MTRPRKFYLSQTDNERAHIASAIVFELSKVTLSHVRERVVAQIRNIDVDLAKRIAEGLAIDLPKATKPARKPVDLGLSDALSIQKNAKNILQGRQVGILFAEGSDKKTIDALKKSIEAKGGTAMLIAPKIGGIKVNGGTLEADGQLAGTPSVLMKAIGHDDGARLLLDHCHVPADADGVSDAGAAFANNAAVRFFDREPDVRDLA